MLEDLPSGSSAIVMLAKNWCNAGSCSVGAKIRYSGRNPLIHLRQLFKAEIGTRPLQLRGGSPVHGSDRGIVRFRVGPLYLRVT